MHSLHRRHYNFFILSMRGSTFEVRFLTSKTCYKYDVYEHKAYLILNDNNDN